MNEQPFLEVRDVPNIGLCVYLNDQFIVSGRESALIAKNIAEALKIPVELTK